MSDLETKESEAQHQIGPGRMLRLARERVGKTQQQMAEKLFLKLDVIEKIELDQFQSNGMSETFIKGYLKMYAKQVGLDEKTVLGAYEALHVESAPPAKLQSFSRKFSREESDNRLMMITYFIAAVLIALVILWFVQKDDLLNTVTGNSETPTPVSNANNQVSEQQQQAEQQILANEKVDDARPREELLQQLTAEKPNTMQPQPESAQVEQTKPESSPTTIAQTRPQQQPVDNTNSLDTQPLESQNTEPEQVADQVELVFTFNGNCWMKLTDASGQAIAYGVKKAGRVMSVSGVPPFKVTLGAPQSVSLLYDGQPVDLSNYRAGKTAKFTLPLKPAN